MDLDLAGIFQFVFNAVGQLPGQDDHLVLADLLGFDHDPDLAAGLDGVGLLHAGIAAGDLLQLLQTLDIVLQVLTAGTGPGGGNGVGRLDQTSHQSLALHVAVVGLDGVEDVLFLLVLAAELHAQIDVSTLELVIQGLADVVEQTGPLGGVDVQAQLRGHKAGNVADLDGVLEDVLAIAGAVMEPSQHLLHLGVEAPDAGLQSGALALALDNGVHLTAGLLHHLLNVGGVDAAVGNELLQGYPGHLTADGLKAGDGNGLRGIVDNKIHTGESLDGADVAALAADNAALHLVIGQGYHTDGDLSHMISGTALDSGGHDLLSPLVGLVLGPGLDLLDLQGSLVGNLGLHLSDQVIFRLLGGKAGNAFQHLRLAALDELDFLLLLVRFRVLLVQGFLFPLNILRLAV